MIRRRIPGWAMRLRPWVVTALAALVLGASILAILLVRASDSDPSEPRMETPAGEADEDDRPVQADGEPVASEPVEPRNAAEEALGRELAEGMVGDDVERLQQRLTGLGLDPGPIDGFFGTQTLQAVWAFEKLMMDVPRVEARGIVTLEMWDRMERPIELVPRRAGLGGQTHIEVYLPEQMLVVFDRDEPALISHVSTGDDHEWCERRYYDVGLDGEPFDEAVEGEVCGVSRTPGGVFAVGREVEGTWRTPLGSLENPVFFNGPLAIHGADVVPAAPVTRGDVRVPLRLSSAIQDLVTEGDPVYVFDGERPPEDVPPNQTQPQVTATTIEDDSATIPPDTIVREVLRDGGSRVTTT